MATLERLTLPVPIGQHVYVLSDLSLSPDAKANRRPIRQLTDMLDEFDDGTTVIVAGNLLFPSADADISFLEQTWAALPQLRHAITDFCRSPLHRFVVLPGSDDGNFLARDDVQTSLRELGITVVQDVTLQVATAHDERDILVTAGSYFLNTSAADPAERADADRLDDPLAVARFVASRTLYRRLGGWVWAPFLLAAVFDLWTTIASVVSHVTAHFTHHRLDVDRLHPANFWNNLIINVLLIGLLETAVAFIASLLVRRRFDRRTRREHTPELSDPLMLTKLNGVDGVELARQIAEQGGAGAIIGGAPRPALAFLDLGVAASPGPSRTVVIERLGRFGLPPVFSAVDRFSMIVIEASTTIHVRLVAGQTSARRMTIFERAVATSSVQPAPSEVTETLGSWPTGNPFPLNLNRLRSQRRQRSIRRWASGLLLIDGVINVARSAAPPLRSHLHAVLAYLPLGAAQSAAAVTAISGILMVMVARGVRRGQRRAWYLAVLVLSLSIFTHLVRGGTVVSSLTAAGVLALLVVQRRNFQATSDRSSLTSSLPRLISIALISVAAAVIGLESTLRRDQLPGFSKVVWGCVQRLVGITSIHFPDRGGDFVTPVLTAIGVTLMVTFLYLMTRPVVDRRLTQASRSQQRRLAELRAREIVRRHGRGTLDYFALRDDKQFFFFRDSLVAYAVYGGVALISPDPIGPAAERTETFSAFRSYAESRGWTIAIMGASQEWLPIYHAGGLHSIYVGDEAVVDCQRFSLEGGKMKGLRQANGRLSKKGYTVEFLDPSDIESSKVPGILELISMLRRGEGERGFSMMLGRLFNPKDKGLLLTVVKDPAGHPAAVCQFVPSPAIQGFSLDLMRRDPGDHPNGLIDYALCSTIEYLRQQGGRGLSLNFSAFRSVLDGERGDGTFTRIERWALKRLSGVLPIETLWSFNAKYYPDWLARYVVYPAAENFVPVLAAILRAESLTEIPVFGRFLTNDPSNRPGTVVPPEVLAAAAQHQD